MLKKLFGKGKKKEEKAPTPAPTPTPTPKVEGTGKVNLEKSVVNLDKTIVNLSKDRGVDLTKHQAKVAVVMDYSGSMSTMYSNGTVQDVLTRLMPIALRFDDDGELDVWLFSNTSVREESMNRGNYQGYVERIQQAPKMRMGGTCYAPVIEDILVKYFEEEKATSDIPAFVIYITDGENHDKGETDIIVREAAKHNIFIQFVGIGNTKFKYLEKLDDLQGRVVDNTGFINIKDIAKLEDDRLYHALLDQYPEWLEEKKNKGI